ncbi:uncharacterized protein LOC133791349 [Humulus lupulus]|uniref:uncharacterized protein LOC133791349 n=1 Tax=Humulus lupulus TaxID=3486 RepID=UPI002B40F0F2|nr:uncharacterized protein LOC133791349 [Humulus lupulus]
MSLLMLPTERHYPAKAAYRGGSIMSTIIAKFTTFDLLERAKQSPFKQFFLAPPLQYSGVIIHQLLLRRVVGRGKNEYCLNFNICGQNTRFGISEFGLITGLNCGISPDQAKYKEMTKSKRLLQTYLNNKECLSSEELEDGFKRCDVKEDVWKLGLCFLVDSLLLPSEPKMKCFIDVLSMVENEDDFFNYPWGRLSYEKTLFGLAKDMERLRNKYLKNVEQKRKRPAPQYTIYGYAIALQYWAYEIFTKFSAFADQQLLAFPRMLSWSAHKMLKEKDIEGVFKKKSNLVKATLNPRPEEKEFHDSIIQGPDELLMGRVISFVDDDVELEFEREEREESPTKPDVADGHRHEQDKKEIPTPINTHHEKLLADIDTLKSNQQRMEEKLDYLIELVLSQRTGSDSEDSLSDEHLASPHHTFIMEHVVGEDSPSCKVVSPGDMAGVEFKRRRVPTKRIFGSKFTDPTKKKKKAKTIVTDPCEINPLQPYDEKQMRRFKKWVIGLKKNDKPISLLAGSCTAKWFIQLLTPRTWLDGLHIDAALGLMKERVYTYKKTYSERFTIVDSMFQQFFEPHWEQFNKKKIKSSYIWPQEVLDYLVGDDNNFKRSWKDIDEVFTPINFSGTHWVLLEISLTSCLIKAYDSDITVVSNKEFENKMSRWGKMLPFLIQSSGLLSHRKDVQLQAQKVRFEFTRLGTEKVPQTKTSGDCGVYVIKHLEYLLAKKSLSEVNDDNMDFFRKKTCVDLFYHNLQP